MANSSRRPNRMPSSAVQRVTLMPHQASTDVLQPHRSAILIIDLQQKLVPVIPSGQDVVAWTQSLLQGADLLDVPSAATVQYPKGLGGLVDPLDQQFPSAQEKLDFSSAVCRTALDRWHHEGRDQILVCGIETHICVLQTVLDLLAEGKQVFIVSEAVAARGGWEHETAMAQMQQQGAIITTVESVFFQWLRSASHPQFKAISKLVKSFADG